MTVTVLTTEMQKCETFEDFQKACIARLKRYPNGGEMLQFWKAHPQIEKEMCPNQARYSGVRNGKGN